MNDSQLPVTYTVDFFHCRLCRKRRVVDCRHFHIYFFLLLLLCYCCSRYLATSVATIAANELYQTAGRLQPFLFSESTFRCWLVALQQLTPQCCCLHAITDSRLTVAYSVNVYLHCCLCAATDGRLMVAIFIFFPVIAPSLRPLSRYFHFRHRRQ